MLGKKHGKVSLLHGTIEIISPSIYSNKPPKTFQCLKKSTEQHGIHLWSHQYVPPLTYKIFFSPNSQRLFYSLVIDGTRCLGEAVPHIIDFKIEARSIVAI